METDRLLDRHARPSETFVLVQHVMESVSVEGGGGEKLPTWLGACTSRADLALVEGLRLYDLVRVLGLRRRRVQQTASLLRH